ncbi:MAG: hypothetical protein HY657_20360 [Acidobacteria bacterium]|nr:hypothetical protein [Acidobacteriota bacterium]
MRHPRPGLACIIAATAVAAACTQSLPPPAATAAGQDGWLAGTVDEKFETVATQLRGFDMAMVETGYRYNELYWAAQDRNWGYAEYQAGKIRTAIESGLKRRPLRAKSAETFLTVALPAVEDAIKQRDSNLLQQQLGALRSTCNTCHEAEKVEFVHVGDPQVRPVTARAATAP